MSTVHRPAAKRPWFRRIAAAAAAVAGAAVWTAVSLGLPAAACGWPDTEAASATARIEFQYRRVGEAEMIAVSGMPEGGEQTYAIEGATPAPLPTDGIIALPPGLAGRVSVAVYWSSGTLVKQRKHRLSMVDLDAARASPEASVVLR